MLQSRIWRNWYPVGMQGRHGQLLQVQGRKNVIILDFSSRRNPIVRHCHTGLTLKYFEHDSLHLIRVKPEHLFIFAAVYSITFKSEAESLTYNWKNVNFIGFTDSAMSRLSVKVTITRTIRTSSRDPAVSNIRWIILWKVKVKGNWPIWSCKCVKYRNKFTNFEKLLESLSHFSITL